MTPEIKNVFQVFAYWILEKILGQHPHLIEAEYHVARATRRVEGYDKLFGNVESARQIKAELLARRMRDWTDAPHPATVGTVTCYACPFEKQHPHRKDP